MQQYIYSTIKIQMLQGFNYLFCIVLIIGCLIQITQQYLEFQLVRVPYQHNDLQHHVKTQCIADTKSFQNSDYKEICYEKDMVYAIELYNPNKELYMLSVDFTLPISWIKSDECVAITPATKQTVPCSRIEVNFKDKVKKLKNKIKDKFFKRNKQQAQPEGKAKIEQYDNSIKVDGSSELVKGNIEKVDNMVFWTKDSGRFTRIVDLLMLGFYVIGEKDQVLLQNTNFIKADTISYNLNYLCDGAISLRFDQSSQKSFLRSIFNLVQNGNGMDESIITIYLGKQHGRNNTMTIGQLSVKNSQGGFSAVKWVNTSIDEDYGHVPQLNSVLFGDSQDQQALKQIAIKDVYAIFTLSASYISIPQKLLQEIFTNMKPYADCSINEQNQYMQCLAKKKTFLQQQIIFDFGSAMMSFQIKNLVAKNKKKNFTLLLRKGVHDGYIILGEPAFKKYFMLFDFIKQRVGFAPQRVTWTENYINVIALIRFIIFTLCIGCSVIICFRPIKKICDSFSSVKKGLKNIGKGTQRQRLRQYSPIQENPYEDVKQRMSSLINGAENDIE